MKNKDVGMGLDDFLSLGGNLLVPFLFHEVTSLHPSSFQRNDFSTCGNCDKKISLLFGNYSYYWAIIFGMKQLK